MSKKTGRPRTTLALQKQIDSRLINGESPTKIIKRYGGKSKWLVYYRRRHLIDAGVIS